MADWIEPLNLELFFVNVFAGSPEIFAAIALMMIAGMGAFFRMNNAVLFLMLGLFFLMFSLSIGFAFVTLIGIFGGLVIGWLLADTFGR